MSRIGLQMYTLRDHIQTPADYQAAIKRVAEIGYQVLQTSTPAFMSAEENAAFLKQHGLSADSVVRPAMEVAAEADSAAKEAAWYGCDVLRTTSIPPAFRERGEEGYRAFAKHMNESGAACRKVGLRYMYHFHAFEWINFGKRRGIDILLDETDPDCVFFCPDVFWLTSAGTEPSRALKMFAGRAFMIHVKDYAIRSLAGKIESVPSFFAPVGTGNLNWEGILETADAIGIQTFVVEQDTCEGDVFEAIRISYDNLVKMGLR